MINFDTSVHTWLVGSFLCSRLHLPGDARAAVRCIQFRSSEVLPFRAILTVWVLPLRLVRTALLLPVLSAR